MNSGVGRETTIQPVTSIRFPFQDGGIKIFCTILLSKITPSREDESNSTFRNQDTSVFPDENLGRWRNNKQKEEKSETKDCWLGWRIPTRSRFSPQSNTRAQEGCNSWWGRWIKDKKVPVSAPTLEIQPVILPILTVNQKGLLWIN